VTHVYKILPGAAWRAARDLGRYDGSPADLTDGFIHLSTAAQAQETARRHFRGQEGLVLVQFDAGRLGAALRWEPSRGGELFPHLYAPLDPALAEDVTPLTLAPDGIPMVGALRP
jgi:uncharacterized protein (DUF952 family)